MIVFKLKDLSKAFNEKTALNRINLDIHEEPLGIIGKSGAGKTTLLKILAGLHMQTQGGLHFRDSPVTAQRLLELRRNVTMIFQSPLFLRGDVNTNLAYGLRLRGVSEQLIDKRLMEGLELISLSGYGDRDVKSLSGGEQQRVALARALILDPDVLLLDEPTSNLDPVNTRIITDILIQESAKRTIIIATHDLDQVKRIAKRVVFLENGEITEEGDPYDMDSIQRFTENVFTGTSRVEEGVAQVTVGEITIRASTPLIGRVSLHVRPQDIIISKDWIETSARNQFRGPITGVTERNGIVMIDVDVREVFMVQITRRSFNEMGLKLGELVNISFKASSVLPL